MSARKRKTCKYCCDHLSVAGGKLKDNTCDGCRQIQNNAKIRCCFTCHYYSQNIWEHYQRGWNGECWRFPPSILSERGSVFPTLKPTIVCGEWLSAYSERTKDRTMGTVLFDIRDEIYRGEP